MEPGAVRSDDLARDAHFGGDLFGRQSSGEEWQHFGLALGEAVGLEDDGDEVGWTGGLDDDGHLVVAERGSVEAEPAVRAGTGRASRSRWRSSGSWLVALRPRQPCARRSRRPGWRVRPPTAPPPWVPRSTDQYPHSHRPVRILAAPPKSSCHSTPQSRRHDLTNVVRLNMYTTDVDAFFAQPAMVQGLAAAGIQPPGTLLNVSRLGFSGPAAPTLSIDESPL